MKNGEGVLSFAAGQSTELAEKICKVLTDATLYEHLSCSSVKAFDRMQIPVDWYLLINRWLANTQNDIDALRVHNLDCVSQ